MISLPLGRLLPDRDPCLQENWSGQLPGLKGHTGAEVPEGRINAWPVAIWAGRYVRLEQAASPNCSMHMVSRLHRLLMRSARLPSVSKANVPGQLLSCHPRCSLTHSHLCRAAKAARLHKSACLKEKKHSVGTLRFRDSVWPNTPQPAQDMRRPVG